MSDKKKSILGKFAGKGYYIALILCAVAIGVSGYLYYRNANQDNPSLENPSGVVDVLNPQGSNPGGTTPDNTAPTLPKPTTPTTPTKKPMKTGKPVSGEMVMDYSMDCLCYNPTTRDWRTHSGVDFAAEAGTPVGAAADGTVYTVFVDETMGTTVVVRHDDGYVTIYSSLAEDVPVSAGDVVVLGQTIGYVGCTALVETAIGDHVHFSVTCDGVTVNPESFFNLG